MLPEEKGGKSACAGAGMSVRIGRGYVVECCVRAYRPAVFAPAHIFFGVVLKYVFVGVFYCQWHIRFCVIRIWREAFGKVCRMCRPIVHLYVYIVVVITSPRGAVVSAPGALQVGGITAGAGGCYEQIPAVLEKQLLHITCFESFLFALLIFAVAFFVFDEQLVCRCAEVFAAEGKRRARKECAVICKVCRF